MFKTIGFFTEIKKKSWIIYVVLTGLVLAVYSYGATNDFVWDDYMVLVDNTFVHQGQNFRNLFNNSYLTDPHNLPKIAQGTVGSGEGSYRPVNTLIHFVEFQLWQLNPFYYHLVSFLIHAGAVCLTFYLLLLMTGRYFVSFVTAALLAVSPAPSEAVYVISFREDLLCALFSLCSFLGYVYGAQSQQKKWYVLSLTAYFLAMLSKESALVLPVVVLAYEILLRKQRIVVMALTQRMIGFVVVGGLYVWIRFVLFAPHASFGVGYISESLWLNILTTLKVLGIYFQWLLFGLGIHVTKADPFFVNADVFEPHVLLFIGVIAFWVRLCLKSGERRNMHRFAFIWFWVFLLPVLGIIPIHNIVAGRYLYLPCVGFFLSVALYCERIRRLSVRTVVLSLLIVFFGILTIARSFTFQNEVTLRVEFLKRYPHISLSYRALSAAYERIDKNYDRAIMALQLGIKKFPDDMRLRMDIARYYRSNRQYEKAIQHLRYILKFDPQHYFALEELCINYALLHEKANADACFQHALSLYPNDPSLTRNYETLRDY